jgi:hypothetical protein
MAKKLFSPKFINQAGSFLNKKSQVKKAISNLNISGTFLSQTNHALTSTQQLNIDYNFFENHTFFHSAVVKTNEAFEKITNSYPYNGTIKEVEGFESKLTGFEKHILNELPKNKGFLIFSGTQTGEAQTNGTYLAVKDRIATEYPTIATDFLNAGKKVLDPLANSFTTQFFINVPDQINDNQIIFQKRSSLANHTTIYLSSSNSTSTCDIGFAITSGTFYMNVTSSIEKGVFKHVSAVYDNVLGEAKLITYNTSSLVSTVVSSSNRIVFNSLNYSAADLTIGRGENARLSSSTIFTPQQSFSGSLDELRYFHEEKTLESIQEEKDKTLYATDNLKLHFRFNEPYGDYTGNDIALDSSQNSLTTKIYNFDYTINRATGSFTPVISENLSRCPVIFPDYEPVETYYNSLITTGSEYDDCNPNIITKLIPPHYLDVGNVFENFESNLSKVNETFDNIKTISDRKSQTNLSVQNLLKFLYTWSKYFDELKLFVDSFSLINSISYEDKNTVPDVLLQKSAKHLGITLPFIFESATLDQFLDGFDLSNNPEKAIQSLNAIQNNIWRRILSDVPFLKKKKGTIESIKSVFRNAGVEPDNLFDVREYGGAKTKSLEESTSIRKDILNLINFSGSIDHQNESVDAQGKSSTAPHIMSSYLSSSRIEIGTPKPRGTFVNKALFSPHGISNNTSDGLFTSGSFTYQANYVIDSGITKDLSLARLHTTGTHASVAAEGCILNLHTDKSSNYLILSINDSPSLNTTTQLILTGVNLYDNDAWAVSFGRECSEVLNTNLTGSIFLRAAKYNAGEMIENYYTSSCFSEASDSLFSNVSTTHNSSGSFVMIGSQSFNDTSLFLNSETSDKKETYFSGKVSNINFWSYGITLDEFRSFAKNHNSVGVKNPIQNYNFNTIKTGSFQRLRVQTSHDQATSASDSSGEIRIFDFSQNNKHISGYAFEASKNIFYPEYVIYEELSPNFDLNTAKTKVRIRSLQDTALLPDHKYAQIGPINEVRPSEEVFDDVRFSMDMSAMKGLNQNILGAFSDFTAFDNALGKPNLVFASAYPDLIELRKIYFENLISDIDLNRYREIFRWLDTTFTEIVYQRIPRNTNFLGINLVYESHVLERHKLSYLYDEIYLKAHPRDPSRGNLFLSQYAAIVKKS